MADTDEQTTPFSAVIADAAIATIPADQIGEPASSLKIDMDTLAEKLFVTPSIRGLDERITALENRLGLVETQLQQAQASVTAAQASADMANVNAIKALSRQ